ncbi:hypothetical protein DB29_03018 [Shouchella clausii]|nr:hypothetical protein DB29_03018 [Shouchella clausii]
MGGTAVKQLVSLIDGHHKKGTIAEGTELIKRGSTKKWKHKKTATLSCSCFYLKEFV